MGSSDCGSPMLALLLQLMDFLTLGLILLSLAVSGALNAWAQFANIIVDAANGCTGCKALGHRVEHINYADAQTLPSNYLFGVQQKSAHGYKSYVVAMHANGSLLASWNFPGLRIWTVTFINSSAFYGLTTRHDTDWDFRKFARFIVYNFQTNVLESLPLPGGTHWAEYDARSNSLLWLQNRLVTVNCHLVSSNGTLEAVRAAMLCPALFVDKDIKLPTLLSDDIVEFALKPKIKETFRFRVFEELLRKEQHLFKFDPFPLKGGALGHRDFVHANCVFKDPAEGVIYLNSLSLSSIFKISYITGHIIWTIGANANGYRMFDEEGNSVSHLFKWAHALTYLGNSTFLMFDNLGGPRLDRGLVNAEMDTLSMKHLHSDVAANIGFRGHRGATRLLKFHVDEARRRAQILWQWTPPLVVDRLRFSRVNGGGAAPLLHGGVVGAFGPAKRTASGDITGHQYVAMVDGQAERLRVRFADSFIYTVTTFYDSPVIQIVSQDTDSVLVHCFDFLNRRWPSEGTLVVSSLCSISSQSRKTYGFHFKPHWQPTEVHVARPAGRVQLVLYNQEGLAGTTVLKGTC